MTSLSLLALSLALLVPVNGIAHSIRHEIAEGTTADKLNLVGPLVELSKHAYEVKGSKAPAPTGFRTVKPAFTTSITGFQARTYLSADGKSVVVAFAGTDFSASQLLLGWVTRWKLGDVATDIQLLSGKVPKQFNQALSYFDKAIRQHPGIEVIATGHSLGGALATYVGMMRKQNSIVFNSPGINKALDDLIPGQHKQSFVDGPYYLTFQSSGDKKGRFGLTQDAVTQSVSKLSGVGIELITLKTGCGADKLCHSVLNFEAALPADKASK